MLLTMVILLCGILGNANSVKEQRAYPCSDTQFGEYPYHVSLRTNPTQHLCSGSIIGQKWVLTSADCVAPFQSSPHLITVLVGTNTLNSMAGSMYIVDGIIPHLGYTSGSYVDNIAVVRVKIPIAFTPTVQPILLATPSPVPSSLTPRLFTAWYPSQSPLPKLKMIYVATTPMSCPAYFSGTTSGTANLCTVSYWHCTCKCDYGGALVTSNGRQVGVLLWVSPCPIGEGDADIFASVPEYRTWIRSQTGI